MRVLNKTGLPYAKYVIPVVADDLFSFQVNSEQLSISGKWAEINLN